MTAYTLADCIMRDCAYYTPEPSSSRMCRCIHPEKINYREGRCPLYKLDWQRAARKVQKAKNENTEPFR